jgi:Ca-activated chloride channel homolog
MIEHLHFLRPLWLFMLLPLAWLLWRHWHRRQQGGAWQSVCDAHLLPHLLIGTDRRAARTPPLLLGVAGLLTVVALAGPVWSKLPQPVYRNSAATVVLLNLSDSMNATDIAPTRLERAKLKLLDFLHLQREGQTALVAYAGEAYVVSPLTDDAETIAALVAPLKSDLMPVSGNQLSDALHKADELLDQDGVFKGGRILLITDSAGDSAALKSAAALRSKDRVLSVLAVGTGQGAPIAAADGGFVKDSSGAIVIPTLNPAALQQLAAAGQGNLVYLTTNDDDLNHLWPVHQASLLDSQHKGEDHVADIWREEGPWLLLLIVPMVALLWRRGWLVMVVLAVLGQPHPAQAYAWRDLWERPDQQAYQVLQHGDAKSAARLFKDPRWQGVAHYRAGDYAAAATGFGSGHDPDALYNQGNALAHAGKLEEAAQAYRQALQQQPSHEDARHNLKIVEDLLKRQQQDKKSEQAKNRNGQQQDQKSQQQQGQSGQNQSQAQQQKQDSQQGQAQQQQAKGQGGQSGHDQKKEQKSANAQQQGAQTAKTDKPDGAPQGEDKQTGEKASSDTPKSASAEQAGQGKEQQPAAEADAADEKAGARNSSVAAIDAKPAKTESAQEMEQWLRRIPDDPGGLLRRKFMLQHQQRAHAADNDGT